MTSHFPKRPSRHDIAVIRSACVEMVSPVSRYFRENRHQFPVVCRGDDDLLNDLIRAFDTDAFRFGRKLEDHCGWHCDFELIEILNEIDISGATEKAVREWVSDNKIITSHGVGDTIPVGEISCTVVSVHRDTAELVIQPPGTDEKYGATGGIVIPIERAGNISPSIIQ